MATEKASTKMSAATLRAKSADELKEHLVELRKEEFKMRMERGSTGQSSNPARFKQIRRDVARIKTVLNEQAQSDKATA